MPNYDYVCTQCGYTEEILQKMTDAPLTECPTCKNNAFKRKIGSGIGLQFHGSGFYSTDYPAKSSSDMPSPPSPPSEGNKKGCGCGKKACDA